MLIDSHDFFVFTIFTYKIGIFLTRIWKTSLPPKKEGLAFNFNSF